MPKKTKLSQADITAFHEAIKDVKPLKHDKIRMTPPPTLTRKTPTHEPKEEVFHLTESESLPLVQSEEFISYKQIGVANKTLRNLRKGQYNIEAILDLHGLTIAQARTAIDSFLQECQQERVQVALIIHGKGLRSPVPILKNKLNFWLRQTNIVLAFCSAAPRHGSRGAIYILLKRVGKEITR